MKLITFYPDDVCEEYQRRVNFCDITFSHFKPWVQKAITQVGQTILIEKGDTLEGHCIDILKACRSINAPGK